MFSPFPAFQENIDICRCRYWKAPGVLFLDSAEGGRLKVIKSINQSPSLVFGYSNGIPNILCCVQVLIVEDVVHGRDGSFGVKGRNG